MVFDMKALVLVDGSGTGIKHYSNKVPDELCIGPFNNDIPYDRALKQG
jgi:hypothetical protein